MNLILLLFSPPGDWEIHYDLPLARWNIDNPSSYLSETVVLQSRLEGTELSILSKILISDSKECLLIIPLFIRPLEYSQEEVLPQLERQVV